MDMKNTLELHQSEKILPNKQEIENVLKRPEKISKDIGGQQVNYILRIQLFIIITIIAIVFIISKFESKTYNQCQIMYRNFLKQGVDVSGQEELIKFANSLVQDVRIQTEELMEELETTKEVLRVDSLGIGAGIWGSTMTLPNNCTTEDYVSNKDFKQPVSGYTVTSRYGWRTDPFTKKKDFHTGIDLAVTQGTSIYPVLSGIVQKTAYNSSYGNYVLILHENGLATKYCHMQYVFVRQGQKVTEQDVIGTVGQTGAATGPHLHFEVLYNDKRYNPAVALGVEK